MSDSEDDDNHLCHRCRQTFVGLDTYVRHRKVKCHKVIDQPKPLEQGPRPTAFGITYDALDKSKQAGDAEKEWSLPSNDRNKDASLGDVMLGDSRKNAMLETFLPEAQHDHDPSLKADDFFSFLELQSSKAAAYHDMPSKKGKETPKKGKSIPLRSMHEVEAYNRGEQFLDDNDYQQSHHKKIYPGNDCLDVLTDSRKSSVMFHSEEPGPSKQQDKHQVESDSSNMESEEDDEDEEAREPTGGKWKPGGRPWEDNYWNPPSTHTGGKWRPSPPSTHTGGKWRPAPPSTHTGGKWKLSPPTPQDQTKPNYSARQVDKKCLESAETEPPPPSHTHGKWLPARSDSLVPELRKSGGQIHYWCGPCNRKLSSRGIYEKHLKSDLHQKRTRQERQLDEDLIAVDKRQDGKRVVKRTKAYLNSSLWSKAQRKRMKLESSPATERTAKAKSRRRSGRVLMQCEVCRSQVWTHLLGKHLVSQYHCKRAPASPALARRQVLENIASVVRQSPFQCGVCKFYFKSSSYFLEHWTSSFHAEHDAKMIGIYCCSYCRYETPSSALMYDHLLGNNHKEAIAVIDHSVPIVIDKRSIIKCEVCEKVFRTNFELRYHAKAYGHAQEGGSGSDKYQGKVHCSLCNFVSFSRKTLQRHLNIKHTDKTVEGKFFCTVCDLQFDTADDSKEHRSTQEHKYKALKQTKKADELFKYCQHCYVVFSDVLALKKHIQEEHPDSVYKCARCGYGCSLKQELSRHIRDGCKGLVTGPPQHDKERAKHQCQKCVYTSTSETDLLFHTALHNEPVYIQKESGSCIAKYFCPACPGMFLKHSLKNHIRSHTRERPFSCKLCDVTFSRKDVLANHMLTVHSVKLSQVYKTAENVQSEGKTKDVLCAECGASFYNKNTLQQHMQIHKGKNFKCKEPDCVSSFRSAGELKTHASKHSDERPFQCNQCAYSSKTKAQLMRHSTVHAEEKSHKCPYCNFTSRDSTHLNRHLRLHTGARPYHCPHCTYKCNLLENLRKHILSTKKHPGKHLYSCKEKDCNFATNFAKEFKVHLVKVHEQLDRVATSYVTGLYRKTEDPRHIDQPIIALKKRKPRKKSTAEEEADEGASESLHPTSNPTLASASLARGSTDVVLQTSGVIEPCDDVIYIQLPPDDTLDGYDTGGHFFSPGDGFLGNPDLNQRTLLFETLSRNRTISLGECSGEVIPLEPDNRSLIVIDEVIEPVTTSSS